MSIPGLWGQSVGAWSGTSELFLHDQVPLASPSNATIATVAQARFLTMAYTWTYEDTPQDGLLLLSQADEAGTITVAWVDSFHMGDKIMHCDGTVSEAGTLDVLGSYTMEGYGTWGWSIHLATTPEGLQLEMYNIAPAGDKELAVRAIYQREATE